MNPNDLHGLVRLLTVRPLHGPRPQVVPGLAADALTVIVWRGPIRQFEVAEILGFPRNHGTLRKALVFLERRELVDRCGRFYDVRFERREFIYALAGREVPKLEEPESLGPRAPVCGCGGPSVPDPDDGAPRCLKCGRQSVAVAA